MNNGYPGEDGKPKGNPNNSEPDDLRRIQGLRRRIHPRQGHEISGVPKDKLEALAKTYADPKTKVCSYWTMGFNQHTRAPG